jgi:CheY-like chemotaxis protein
MVRAIVDSPPARVCIEAGASDYVAKPVEAEHLLGLLRAWVHH